CEGETGRRSRLFRQRKGSPRREVVRQRWSDQRRCAGLKAPLEERRQPVRGC
ncbi:MAG: hypothetical protein AVDCRST_MAG62-934, partial [uncultured Sphingomonas sp.]